MVGDDHYPWVLGHEELVQRVKLQLTKDSVKERVQESDGWDQTRIGLHYSWAWWWWWWWWWDSRAEIDQILGCHIFIPSNHYYLK